MPLNQNQIKMLDQQILNPLIDLSSIQDSSAIELKSILEERLSLIEEDLEESLYDYVAGLPDNNDALKAFSLVRECLFQSHPQNLSLRDANEIKKNSHNLSPHLQERASLIASMNFNEEEDYYQSILHNITLQNGVELLEQPFGVLGISVADTPEHRATKDDVKTHIEQRLNYAKESTYSPTNHTKEPPYRPANHTKEPFDRVNE